MQARTTDGKQVKNAALKKLTFFSTLSKAQKSKQQTNSDANPKL
jgi:hypothetical protein